MGLFKKMECRRLACLAESRRRAVCVPIHLFKTIPFLILFCNYLTIFITLSCLESFYKIAWNIYFSA